MAITQVNGNNDSGATINITPSPAEVMIETMVHISVGDGILIAVTTDEARELFHELGQYLNRLND